MLGHASQVADFTPDPFVLAGGPTQFGALWADEIPQVNKRAWAAVGCTSPQGAPGSISSVIEPPPLLPFGLVPSWLPSATKWDVTCFVGPWSSKDGSNIKDLLERKTTMYCTRCCAQGWWLITQVRTAPQHHKAWTGCCRNAFLFGYPTTLYQGCPKGWKDRSQAFAWFSLDGCFLRLGKP